MVSTGRVVVVVAVTVVDRNLVKDKKGSKKMFNRVVKEDNVSSISSNVVGAGSSRYLLKNIPKTNSATATTFPAQRNPTSPYKTAAQKAATTRKLSQGSFVVQVSRPATQFNPERYGKA